MRIDAHQHFWRYNDADYSWMGDNPILKQDYLPSHLYPALVENGLSGTIAVQARTTLAENEFLIELKEANDTIKGIVGWVDLTDRHVEATLNQYADALVGIRHPVHDEASVDFMLRDDFRRGLAMLSNFGLAYDLLIRPDHLDNTLLLVDELPHQTFVIDHLAKPAIATGAIEPWRRGITELAKRDNVYCKLSGLVTEANFYDWSEEELPLHEFAPFLDATFEAFGANRIMFGSDWPVCTLAAPYDEVYDLASEYLRQLSTAEQDQVMGKTAVDVYSL